MSIHEASLKISKEIQKSSNPYVKVIGDFLLKEVIKNKEAAEIIANTDKTIIGSLEAMREVASKKIVKNCAVLTDDEGFNIVCAYYGFEREIIGDIVVSAPDMPKNVKTGSRVIDFKSKASKKETKKAKKMDKVDGQVSLFDF